MRCALILFFACAGFAATFEASPRPVPQGDTLRVETSVEAATARMNGRTIRLFPQKTGGWLGLMPVPVTEKPGEYVLEIVDKNGAVIDKTSVTVADAHFPSQNVVLSPSLSELKSTPDERETVAEFQKEVLDDRYWTEPLRAPVPGCMTSLFGVQRLHNGKPTGDFHAGLDMRAREGYPIRAAAAGIVKIARPLQLHGGTVAIEHGQGLHSIYLHMSKIVATEGQTVQAGDVIGYAGSTGRSTASHLHWSLYANGVPVNPLQWVKVAPCEAARPRAHTRRAKQAK